MCERKRCHFWCASRCSCGTRFVFLMWITCDRSAVPNCHTRSTSAAKMMSTLVPIIMMATIHASELSPTMSRHGAAPH